MSRHQAPRRSAANAGPSPTHRGFRTGARSTYQWLFRSNIPRRRDQPLLANPQKRTFFGIGEIVQVVTNPASTLRSLTESRRLLEDARREISEGRERAQLRPSHTFSRLPNFFPRPAELEAVGRVLEEEPCFTVLFGASSVGKTALLRQLLTSDKYHVLHFDLRIAGFADLDSLYISLSQQMEQYFNYIAETEGYEDFEKEAWGFKHDRLGVERRLSDSNGTGQIKTSDIARLMELFQSSLLKYREFLPVETADKGERNSVQPATTPEPISTQSKPKRSKWWRFGTSSRTQVNRQPQERVVSQNGQAAEKPKLKHVKKMPVFFLDEAHKLPGLIQSIEAMKSLLDSMLVLTKQDRLCHVIHATSDPFYQTWLRQLNVMQHCKIITIGDCSKTEARAFYEERILPRVPEHLRRGLEFERLYEAFGGRLVHWQDYVTDYVNANGRLEIHQSSHFIQAHALLNLHIIHSSQTPQAPEAHKPRSRRNSTATALRQSTVNPPNSPTRGGNGFPIYSPLTGPPRNPHASLASQEPGYVSDFTALQLLRVMSRLTQPGARTLPYFMLCREFGVRAVDGMVRGRILDLRWMDPVTKEALDHGAEATTPSTRFDQTGGASRRISLGVHLGASSSGTAIMSESVEMDGEPFAISERDAGFVPEDEEIFGPKVLPATPIMRYAMREVVAEYEDTRSVSEYASLSDPDEY